MNIRANDRFAELDGLRGIAALWVVIYHYISGPFQMLSDHPAYDTHPLFNASAPNLQGLHAVHLFFLVSGFVIFMTLQRSATVLDFAVSRFARLYPAFWTAVIIATVIAFNLGCRCDVTLEQAAINMTMLNLFVGVTSIVGQAWSLAYELGFYLFIAIIFSMGKLGKIEWYGSLWVAASFVFMKLIPQLGGPELSWRINAGLGLEYASLFFAGIIFYKIWSEGVTRGRLLLILLCYLEHIYGYHQLWAEIVAGIFFLFMLCVLGFAKFLSSRVLVFLGTISYSLYLIHIEVARLVQPLVEGLDLPRPVNFLLAVIAAIGVAAVISTVVEHPANRAIKRSYRLLSQRYKAVRVGAS